MMSMIVTRNVVSIFILLELDKLRITIACIDCMIYYIDRYVVAHVDLVEGENDMR